ncbi:MAG: hypothetical protein M3Z85_03950 [Acidobacteriota bacterium]|nr:hypothetical protein [Acidobacteriota bacterium]
MRRLLLLLFPLLHLAGGAQVAHAQYVQSVEFPYSSYPRQFWERELVWLKNIGIRSVTCPVRPDAADFLQLVQRLGMTAIAGPKPAPQPVFSVSALSPSALVLSREFLSKAKGSLLWTDVEDTVSPTFLKGAISFTGEEQPTLSALRRNAGLLQRWGGLLDSMTVATVHPVTGKFPAGVTGSQLIATTGDASAVSIVNRSESVFRGDLRVDYPSLKRSFVLPIVNVPANEALWLPVDIQLNKSALCEQCAPLGNGDRIVYATAELTGVEYENGILAMEFAAPMAGEVVLQLSREPSGPLLAAAKPTNFDWDEKTSRVRLSVPAGSGPAHRVRIALAIQPPDASAFLVDAKSLIIGQTNRIATSYSSEAIAKRSRLRLSENWKIRREIKSPLEIDYWIDVPADAFHGDRVSIEIEADGAKMSHARLQLLRPASLRIREAIGLHFGMEAELPLMPALIPVDQKAGREIAVVIRNNFPEIRNYTLQIESPDLEFSPAKVEVSTGASMERDVSIRVFAEKATPGLHLATIELSGPAKVTLTARLLVIPRGETVVYSADFDQDGQPEHILESQKVRAVFSNLDGGRWMEFVWKDSGLNALPEAGIKVGKARLALRGAELTIETSAPEPPSPSLKSEKRGDIFLQVQRPAPNRAIYSLSR